MSNRNFSNARTEISPKNQWDNLKQILIEKDRQISQLQSNINKLELKNKQFVTFEAMLEQSDNKANSLENEIMEIKEKLRQKTVEAENSKSKLKELEAKNRNELKSRGSYVRKQDYEVVKKQLMDLKQNMRQNTVDRTLQDMKEKLEVSDIINKRLQAEKQDLSRNLTLKTQQLLNLKSEYPQPDLKGAKLDNHYEIKELESQIDRLNIQLSSANLQKQQYRSKSQALEYKLQEYVHTSSEWSTHNKNLEYLNKISQYEDHIQSMASKISAIHKLQMEKNEVQKQRREFKIECESLKEENNSLKHYIENLEQKIRKIEQYGQNYLEIDMQRFQMANKELSQQLQKFFQKLGYREEDLNELKQKMLQITRLFNEQMIISMESTLNSLQQSLNDYKQRLHDEQQRTFKEQQKSMKIEKQLKSKQIEYNEIKSQLGKINRMISQKMQKIEFQAVQIKRLTGENQEKQILSEKVAKLQKTIVDLQNKNDDLLDQNNQLLMALLATGIELDRVHSQDKVSPELIQEIEALNAKAVENQINSKNIQQRINRLQHLHKCVVEESVKISEHLHMSHKRWNFYDISMQELNKFLEKTIENTDKTYMEIDRGIQENIKRHEKVIESLKQKEEEELEKLMKIEQAKVQQNIEESTIADQSRSQVKS